MPTLDRPSAGLCRSHNHDFDARMAHWLSPSPARQGLHNKVCIHRIFFCELPWQFGSGKDRPTVCRPSPSGSIPYLTHNGSFNDIHRVHDDPGSIKRFLVKGCTGLKRVIRLIASRGRGKIHQCDSLGTVFSMSVVTASNDKVLSFLRKKGIKTCATVVDAQTAYYDAPLTGPAPRSGNWYTRYRFKIDALRCLLVFSVENSTSDEERGQIYFRRINSSSLLPV